MIKVTKQSLSKKCPPPLKALLTRVDYSYQRAADLAGLTKSTIGNAARGQVNLGPKAGAKIRQALDQLDNPGRAPAIEETVAGGACKRGLAICTVTPHTLVALLAAGEAFGGHWVYRKRQPSGKWLLILDLKQAARLKTFSQIAGAMGEVVTP